MVDMGTRYYTHMHSQVGSRLGDCYSIVMPRETHSSTVLPCTLNEWPACTGTVPAYFACSNTRKFLYFLKGKTRQV